MERKRLSNNGTLGRATVSKTGRRLPAHIFTKGHKRVGGRVKGTPNKTTTLLKDAIIEAATLSGADGKGKDKLVGYLVWVSRKRPEAFCTLLGKVLPLHLSVHGQVEMTDARDRLTKKIVELQQRQQRTIEGRVAVDPIRGRETVILEAAE